MNSTVNRKVLSLVLILALIVGLIPSLSYVNAEATSKERANSNTATVGRSEKAPVALEANPKPLIAAEDLTKEDIIKEELTEDTTTFDMGNGVKKTILHGGEVRYKDERGKWVDNDQTLVPVKEKDKTKKNKSLKGYKFKTKAGDKKNYIPEAISEDTPVLMEYDKYALSFAPADSTVISTGEKLKKVKTEKEKIPKFYKKDKKDKKKEEIVTTGAIYESTGEEIEFEYISGDMGIKENIILNEIPKTNKFIFNIKAAGMYPKLDTSSGAITFYDNKTDDGVADIAAPFMNDAGDDLFNDTDLKYSLKEKEGADNQYVLTLTIDESYLKDEKRVYPVTIDPSTVWKSGSFQDAHVCSGKYANNNYYTDSFTKVGIDSQGKRRIFTKHPDLRAIVHNRSVASAYMYVYENASGVAGANVSVHKVNESWARETITWNNQPSYSATTNNTGFTSSGARDRLQSMDVTPFVQGLSRFNPSTGAGWDNYGLMMKTGENKHLAIFYSSNHSTTVRRPYLVVNHYSVPTPPTDVTVYSPLNNGDATINAVGINSDGLSYAQYRVVRCNSAGTVLSTVIDYSASTVMSTSGPFFTAAIPSLPTDYYRVYVRGVNAAGVAGGEGVSNLFYVDKTLPTIGSTALTDKDGRNINNIWANTAKPDITFNTFDDNYDMPITGVTYAIVKSGVAPTEADYRGIPILGMNTTRPFSGRVILPSDVINLPTGVYDIYVRAKDSVGNVTVAPKMIFKKDVDKPIGDIILKENILEGQTPIEARIDGTGSPVVESYLKLYDANDRLVATVDNNLTMDDLNYEFNLADYPNGEYYFKMYLKDEVGHTNVITKDITIETPMPAPALNVKEYDNDTPLISYKFNEDKQFDHVEYKLDDSENWISVSNSESIKGSFRITSPLGIETYDIHVRGVDKVGVAGKSSVLTFIVDETAPEVSIEDFIQGELIGSINDRNLKSWNVSIKGKNALDETYEEVLSGNKNVTNAAIGFIDISGIKYIPGITYTIKLEATDIINNESETTFDIVKPLDGSEASLIESEFRIKRPGNQSYDTSEFLIAPGVQKLSLTGAGISRIYKKTWYLEGVFANIGNKYERNFSYLSHEPYNILVRSDTPDGPKFSSDIIRNAEIFVPDFSYDSPFPDRSDFFDLNPMNPNLEKMRYTAKNDIVSFRIVTDDDDPNYAVCFYNDYSTMMDMRLIAVEANTTHYVSDIDLDTGSTNRMMIRPLDGPPTGDVNVKVELDTVVPETFKVSDIEKYAPTNLSAIEKINYKVNLRWDNKIDESTPSDIFYEVHRGTSKDFIPNDDTLVNNSIREGYFVEINAWHDDRYYYKVRAVRKDENGNVIEQSTYSNEVYNNAVDSDEYKDRLGVKEYWSYADFNLPMGTASIEKSAGNFVYTQTDVTIPNDKLAIDFNRTYNSQASVKTSLGISWTHDYDMSLLKIGEGDPNDFKDIVFKDETGTLYQFARKDGTREYISSMGKYITLKEEEKTEEVLMSGRGGNVTTTNDAIKMPVTSKFTMKIKGGLEYRFNYGGELVFMKEANGNFLLFDYDDERGRLISVTTNRNIKMELEYSGETGGDSQMISEIKLPDGSKRKYNYTGSNNRLSKVTYIPSSKGGTPIEYSINYEGIDIISEGDIEDDTIRKKVAGLTDGEGNTYNIDYDDEKAVRFDYPTDSLLGGNEYYELDYSADGGTTTTSKYLNGVFGDTKLTTEKDFFKTDDDVHPDYKVPGNAGYLVRTIDTEGKETTYEFQDYLLKKSETEAEYQVLDEVTGEIRNEQTVKVENIQYDQNENVTSEVNTATNTGEEETSWVYVYHTAADGEYLDGLPILEKEVDSGGKVISETRYRYDSYGNETMIYDTSSDTTTEYTYYGPEAGEDLEGEIKSEVQYMGNGFIGEKKFETVTTYQYTYGADNSKTEIITAVTGPDKTVTTTVYDCLGRTLSESTVNSKTDGSSESSKVTENTYDGHGRRLTSTLTETAPGVAAKVSSTENQYDKNSTVTSEAKSVDGTAVESKSYTFDSLNRVIETVTTRGSDSRTSKTDYSYEDITQYKGSGSEAINVNKALKTTETEIGDGESFITGETYTDSLGNTVRSFANGLYTDTFHDCDGNVISTVELGTDLDIEKAKITASVNDSLGNLTHEVINPEYMSGGNYVVTQDSIVNESIYNTSNQVIGEINGEGQETGFEYNSKDELTKVTLPDGTDTAYTYNDVSFGANSEELKTDTVRYANGAISKTVKDKKDQVIEIRDGGGVSADIYTEFKYDPKGNKIRETYSGGNYKTFRYDAKDRVVESKSFNAGSNTEAYKTEYEYDRNNNMTLMKDSKVVNGVMTLSRYTKYEYDFLNRLTSKAELNGPSEPTASGIESKTLYFDYDISDNIISIDYPDTGNSVKGLRFEYDSNKWLTEVIAVLESSEETIREYTYDSMGKVDKIINHNDFYGDDEAHVIREHSYDEFSRPTEITYRESDDSLLGSGTSGAAILESYKYSYDKNNNILTESLENNLPISAGDKIDQMRTYTYDSVNRLKTSATIGRGVQSVLNSQTEYGYDNVGNMVKETKDGAVTTNAYNDLNQLLESRKVDSGGNQISTTNLAYNKYGNQVKETTSQATGSAIRNMEYDVDNRLTKVSYEGAGATVKETQTNSYNGNGQRIQKTVGDKATNYYYQNTGVLYTTDGSNGTNALNLLGTSDNVITTARTNDQAEDYYFYHKDVRESTTNLVSDYVESITSYDYSDFGETKINGDTEFYNEIAYTGGIYDKDTVLYYLNARYYNPNDARFLTQDTHRGVKGKPETLHLYAYCANNPINFIDPSGHKAKAIYANNTVKYIVGVVENGWLTYEVRGYLTVKYTKSKVGKKTIRDMDLKLYGNRQASDSNNGWGRLVNVKIYKGKKRWKTIKGRSEYVKPGGAIIYGTNTCVFVNKQINKNFAVGKKKITVKAYFYHTPPTGAIWRVGKGVTVEAKF